MSYLVHHVAFIEATVLEHLPNIEYSGRKYYLSHATYLFLVPETWSQAKIYCGKNKWEASFL